MTSYNSTYNEERLPVIKRMIEQTLAMYNIVVDGREKPKGATEPDAAAAWRGRQNMKQLGINYRWSPVVYDFRGTNGLNASALMERAYKGYPGEDVRAGDRAPDAPALVDAAGEETALFDIFKSYHHTLLVFSPRAGLSNAEINGVLEATRSLVEAGAVKIVILGHRDSVIPKDIPGTKVLKDTQGYAYNYYHVNGNALTLVAVRPDGYVGALVQDVQGLQRYLTKVFLGV